MYTFSLVLGRKELITKTKTVYFTVVKGFHKLQCHSPYKGVIKQILLLPFSDEVINSEKLRSQGWSH